MNSCLPVVSSKLYDKDCHVTIEKIYRPKYPIEISLIWAIISGEQVKHAVIKLNRNLFFLLALLSIIVISSFFLINLNSKYAPYYEDESFYIKNAEIFFHHNTLEAAFTYTGKGSRILGTDAHGPAYPLFYGIIAKLTGWNPLLIPLVNLAILIFMLLVLAKSKSEDKSTFLIQAIVILGCPITLFYSLTFLPELLHISGSIGLFVFLDSYLKYGKKSDYYALFFMILVLGIFRSTWYFALPGLVALPKLHSRKITPFILIALAILLPLFFQYYFHEQVNNAFSETINLLKEDKRNEATSLLVINLKNNLKYLFTYSEGWYYTFQKIWFAVSIVVGLLCLKSNPIIKFSLIHLSILLIFNLVFYKFYSWVELRIFTPTLILLNLGLIASQTKKSLIPTTINFISFLLILPFLSILIKYRLDSPTKKIPLTIIQELKQSTGDQRIGIKKNLLYEFNLSQLPISSNSGKPIRYILPYYPLTTASTDYWLTFEKGQIKVSSKNSLFQ